VFPELARTRLNDANRASVLFHHRALTKPHKGLHRGMSVTSWDSPSSSGTHMQNSAAYLIAVLLGFGLPQLLKAVYWSVRRRQVAWRELFASGGMPSSHSSLVTALAVTTVIKLGVTNPVAVLAGVGAGVVIYDSTHVRRAAGEQSIAIEQILRQHPTYDDSSHTSIATPYLTRGHTPAEVVAGMAFGAIVAVVVSAIW
jgi:acid phosphatase family membrane protein YuiD